MTTVKGPDSTIRLNLLVHTQKFNGRWQAYYGDDSGQLLTFNCTTRAEALLHLKKVLIRTLDELGKKEPLC